MLSHKPSRVSLSNKVKHHHGFSQLTVHFDNRILNPDSIEASRRSIAPHRSEIRASGERNAVAAAVAERDSIEEPRRRSEGEARVSLGHRRRRYHRGARHGAQLQARF